MTAADIAALVPDAQGATIFALVAALGRGDRTRALEILDILVREGEYMPLALTFLATQFRMALVAREANLRSAAQIQGYFNKLGARIWPERARQIEHTIAAFPKERLERAVAKLFKADRSLRDARRGLHEPGEIVFRVHDLHPASTEHIRGPDQHRIPDPAGELAHLLKAVARGRVGLEDP